VFKVKIDSKQFDRIEESLLSKFNKVANSEDLKSAAADLVISDIKFQTRRGVSIPDGRSLPGQAFSAKRSNLTLSGQLIESLKSRFITRGVEVFPDGDHEPYRYKGKRGKIVTSGEKIKNSKLAEHLKKKGFDFIGVRDSIKERIKILVQQQIRREFKSSK